MRRALAGSLLGLGLLTMGPAGCLAPTPDAAMQETTWLAEAIGGEGITPGVQSTLRVDPDGRASGSAACNRFTGSATLAGDEVRFGPLATTRRMCPPDVMDQEDRYLAALAAARRFVLEDETLRLRDERDVDLVRFIVTDAPE
jgi:putative lipoprotein